MLATDSIDLLLNAVTGDLAIPPVLSSNFAGVVQAARVRLATIAGEWFLDLDAGVPYYERSGVAAAKAIFGQKFDQAKAIAAFRTAILSTPGIVSISTLTVFFTGTTRAITVQWQARTVFGDTPVDTLALGV